MNEPRRSSLDRLEARLEAQTARIDALYRMLEIASNLQTRPRPRRRPIRRRERPAPLWDR